MKRERRKEQRKEPSCIFFCWNEEFVDNLALWLSWLQRDDVLHNEVEVRGFGCRNRLPFKSTISGIGVQCSLCH